MKWFIIERSNPWSATYYILAGQLTDAEAERRQKTKYGKNVMLSFETEEQYNSAIWAIKKTGKKVVA